MRKSFLLVSVLALVLSACNGDTGDTTTTSGDSTTTTVSETTTTEPSESTTTTGDEGTTTTATAGGSGGGGDECVVGTWVLDDEAFFEAVFAEFADEQEGIGEVTPSGGEFTTTLNANGTVQAVRTDWGFSVETEEGTFHGAINGEQSGTWEIEGSKLLLTLDEGAGFDVEATVEVDGERIPLPSAPIDVPAEALSSSSDYECDGDTLSVTNEGVTSVFVRS